jgi:polyhydroxyalkanoate synthesis regulator phasin
MAAPDNGAGEGLPRGQKNLLEQLVLVGLGAASLTKERVDELADSLAERGGINRDEARAAINDVAGRWRGDVTRASERAGTSLQGILRELGLVLRSEVEELELRVAQLEHRLKLVETTTDAVPPPTAD